MKSLFSLLCFYRNVLSEDEFNTLQPAPNERDYFFDWVKSELESWGYCSALFKSWDHKSGYYLTVSYDNQSASVRPCDIEENFTEDIDHTKLVLKLRNKFNDWFKTDG